jgi:hypothetical protein
MGTAMRTMRFRVAAVGVVFGALLAGLLVGAATRRGPATDQVADAAPTASATDDAQLRQLREALDARDGDLAAQQRLVDGLAKAVLNGRLRGVRVLLISTRSESSDVDGVVAMLVAAGASVSGRVELADAFLDTANAADLLAVATHARPADVTGDLPADGVGASAALLAAVLLVRTPAVSTQDMASVLAAYSGRGYLRVGTPDPVPGDAVVVLGGVPLTGVDQLRRADPLVVADRQAAGVVARIRADPRLSVTVSTVDNVDTPPGRLVTAWALADQIAGTTGHYGTGDGATLLPP